MAFITLDTLKFSDTLKAAGVPFAQAEAEARAVSAVIGDVDVATRRDVEVVRRSLNSDIDGVRKDMMAMAQRLIIKLGGIIAVMCLQH